MLETNYAKRTVLDWHTGSVEQDFKKPRDEVQWKDPYRNVSQQCYFASV